MEASHGLYKLYFCWWENWLKPFSPFWIRTQASRSCTLWHRHWDMSPISCTNTVKTVKLTFMCQGWIQDFLLGALTSDMGTFRWKHTWKWKNWVLFGERTPVAPLGSADVYASWPGWCNGIIFASKTRDSEFNAQCRVAKLPAPKAVTINSLPPMWCGLIAECFWNWILISCRASYLSYNLGHGFHSQFGDIPKRKILMQCLVLKEMTENHTILRKFHFHSFHSKLHFLLVCFQ